MKEVVNHVALAHNVVAKYINLLMQTTVCVESKIAAINKIK
jgi:hypothetical protein